MSAAKWQGNDQTVLQCQAARHCHHQIQWATCAAWHWGSGPHSEGEKAPLVWTWHYGMLQWCRKDSLWPTGWWKAWAWEAQDDTEAADREGLQRVEALDYRPSWQTYLEIWCEICHACSKPATWKGAHWCGCCPCTCKLIKTLMMMMIHAIYRASLGGSVGCKSNWWSGGYGFVGNILLWRLIMKYFLQSFSPFRWFKKGSCQFLGKNVHNTG